ncbi:MAG: DUF1858 domain-containing protein [Bacteroidales bacterium]|nr:DUF1858 domain-containing protein [Bacteroidales bacterium]MCF8375319.1 DUF1858 domain-containing protein [Bacteroidales bacterium]MCF8400175.1 DUF1858 domain-containing protein [Bacteroidales bacterium]
MSEKLIITPKTKVGELLKAYPELESKLVELAPEFKKLRNPVLRRTIARVTSLQQAARVGGVSVDEIVNKLRKAAGQDEIKVEEATHLSGEKPDWLDEKNIRRTFDATETIAAGGHPLDIVLRETRKMKPGEIYLLLTPFLPAPLIDKVKEMGFETWTEEQNGVFRNFFYKTSPP